MFFFIKIFSWIALFLYPQEVYKISCFIPSISFVFLTLSSSLSILSQSIYGPFSFSLRLFFPRGSSWLFQVKFWNFGASIVLHRNFHNNSSPTRFLQIFLFSDISNRRTTQKLLEIPHYFVEIRSRLLLLNWLEIFDHVRGFLTFIK